MQQSNALALAAELQEKKDKMQDKRIGLKVNESHSIYIGCISFQ